MLSEEEEALSLFRVSMARSTRRLGIRVCESEEEEQPWQALDTRGAFLVVRVFGAVAILVGFDCPASPNLVLLCSDGALCLSISL